MPDTTLRAIAEPVPSDSDPVALASLQGAPHLQRRASGPKITPEDVYLRSMFMFNHPRIVSGEVYGEGRRARANGQDIAACPYILSCYEHDEWCRGWNGAHSDWPRPEISEEAA